MEFYLEFQLRTSWLVNVEGMLCTINLLDSYIRGHGLNKWVQPTITETFNWEGLNRTVQPMRGRTGPLQTPWGYLADQKKEGSSKNHFSGILLSSNPKSHHSFMIFVLMWCRTYFKEWKRGLMLPTSSTTIVIILAAVWIKDGIKLLFS